MLLLLDDDLINENVRFDPNVVILLSICYEICTSRSDALVDGTESMTTSMRRLTSRKKVGY